MSLIHMKGTITRALALTVLSTAPAFAGPELWEPQQTQTGTRQPAAVAPRARSSACAGCSDSVRSKHEVLVTKLDSLRWEFVNRRLTEAEQKTLEIQMNATLMALREFMEANGTRARVSVTGPAQGGAMAGGTGGSYSYTIQTARRGYIGIQFDGPSYGYPPERPDVIRFIQYPKVASVDPASPAERAGLIVGDTLLAMNGTDVVENSITLSKILIPDEKVTLRVRRAGDAKEFSVLVAEAPAYIVRRVTPLPAEAFTFEAAPGSAAPAPGAPSRVEVRGGRTPEPPVAAVAPSVPMPSRLFVFGSAVGGARVQTVTEGLAKALGVKEGVLVMEVPPGSPAFYSGLKDGDVIISVAGDEVATASALTGVLRFADREQGVKLVIIREKKQQEVLLRWK